MSSGVRDGLAIRGFEIAEALEKLAASFNPKSRHSEVIDDEVYVIRSYCELLLQGGRPPSEISSGLLRELISESDDARRLFSKLAKFYADLQEVSADGT